MYMHTVTITSEQANGRFLPADGRYMPMAGTDGKYLYRKTDGRIVTQHNDFLSDQELTELRQLWRQSRKAIQPKTPAELDRAWVERAIEGELDQIVQMAGDKPHKPDSPYWASLCRLAGAVKGSGKAHVRPSDILVKLLRFTPDMHFKLSDRDRAIAYLWGRAMNRAPARYRANGGG